MGGAGHQIPIFFFFSSRRRHTRSLRDWSSDVCSSDLPEAEVVEADVGERLEAGPHLGDVGEEGGRLGDGQLEDVADRPPPEADLEDLRPKARPAALGAGHVDVGEELHLDLLEALAGARLAAAARDVEGEGGRRVAPETRLLGAREAGTDAVE